MIATGRLTITATDSHDLEAAIATGRLHVRVTDVVATASGELLTHVLRPLLIEALTPIAAGVPRDESNGALVRVFVHCPDKEA